MQTTNIWINEFLILSDPLGIDIEVVFEGVPGDADIYAVQHWTRIDLGFADIILSSTVPDVTLASYVATWPENGVTFAFTRLLGLETQRSGISSLGLVLYNTNTNAVVEFLVFGDPFSPNSGPASGQVPTRQILSPTLSPTLPIHYSLEFEGCAASSFTWNDADEVTTFGSPNNDQSRLPDNASRSTNSNHQPRVSSPSSRERQQRRDIGQRPSLSITGAISPTCIPRRRQTPSRRLRRKRHSNDTPAATESSSATTKRTTDALPSTHSANTPKKEDRHSPTQE